MFIPVHRPFGQYPQDKRQIRVFVHQPEFLIFQQSLAESISRLQGGVEKYISGLHIDLLSDRSAQKVQRGALEKFADVFRGLGRFDLFPKMWLHLALVHFEGHLSCHGDLLG